jgi:hypothetical protein
MCLVLFTTAVAPKFSSLEQPYNFKCEHLLSQYAVCRNNLTRTVYFLVLNSFALENLKQTEILYTSEHSKYMRAICNEIGALGKVVKF